MENQMLQPEDNLSSSLMQCMAALAHAHQPPIRVQPISHHTHRPRHHWDPHPCACLLPGLSPSNTPSSEAARTGVRGMQMPSSCCCQGKARTPPPTTATNPQSTFKRLVAAGNGARPLVVVVLVVQQEANVTSPRLLSLLCFKGRSEGRRVRRECDSRPQILVWCRPAAPGTCSRQAAQTHVRVEPQLEVTERGNEMQSKAERSLGGATCCRAYA